MKRKYPVALSFLHTHQIPDGRDCFCSVSSPDLVSCRSRMLFHVP